MATPTEPDGKPYYKYVVSGDANFNMMGTRLTIGGFTQPGVARNIIDMPSNAEKGLSHAPVCVDISQTSIW